jgi:hypothetical protein
MIRHFGPDRTFGGPDVDGAKAGPVMHARPNRRTSLGPTMAVEQSVLPRRTSMPTVLDPKSPMLLGHATLGSPHLTPLSPTSKAQAGAPPLFAFNLSGSVQELSKIAAADSPVKKLAVNKHSEKLRLYVEPSDVGDLHIFAGTSSRELAAEIAAKLDMMTGRASLKRFADGEVFLC